MTGFVNIDKREGDTSTFVVNQLKRLSRCSCGHMGTLDPLASGVLPIGIGNAARLFEYFLGKTKTYRAQFRFGVTTETLDRESELQFGGSVPSAEEIERIIPKFMGEIEQIPPIYSAKMIGGVRSYELARRGREVALSAKRVTIENFRLLSQVGVDEFSFEIICGGGTYIRSLARDLAKALGTQGFMNKLERVRSGVFTLETAVDLHSLTRENWKDYLIPTEEALPFPKLEEVDERYFRGVRYAVGEADGVYKIYRDGTFYGTGIVEDGILRPEKKLC